MLIAACQKKIRVDGTEDLQALENSKSTKTEAGSKNGEETFEKD